MRKEVSSEDGGHKLCPQPSGPRKPGKEAEDIALHSPLTDSPSRTVTNC